ncbi:hypothetical protein MRB53_040729 [Persea americana]|nr:hypothetical protein MRB53_040729 [Persea americana]
MTSRMMSGSSRASFDGCVNIPDLLTKADRELEILLTRHLNAEGIPMSDLGIGQAVVRFARTLANWEHRWVGTVQELIGAFRKKLTVLLRAHIISEAIFDYALNVVDESNLHQGQNKPSPIIHILLQIIDRWYFGVLSRQTVSIPDGRTDTKAQRTSNLAHPHNGFSIQEDATTGDQVRGLPPSAFRSRRVPLARFMYTVRRPGIPPLLGSFREFMPANMLDSYEEAHVSEMEQSFVKFLTKIGEKMKWNPQTHHIVCGARGPSLTYIDTCQDWVAALNAALAEPLHPAHLHYYIYDDATNLPHELKLPVDFVARGREPSRYLCDIIMNAAHVKFGESNQEPPISSSSLHSNTKANPLIHDPGKASPSATFSAAITFLSAPSPSNHAQPNATPAQPPVFDSPAAYAPRGRRGNVSLWPGGAWRAQDHHLCQPSLRQAIPLAVCRPAGPSL